MRSGELLNLLKETGAIMDGHLLLTSGRHSNVYIEKFRVLENPAALNEVCREMAEIVKNQNIKLVLGAAVGGILISGGVGRQLGKKHIFAERIDGKMELRRGFSIKSRERIVIVEDIITTGGSVIELIHLAEEQSAEIVHIVNLVDRSPKGIDFVYPSTALLHLPSDSFKPDDCPSCKQGLTIIKRGRTGKKMVTA